MVSRSLIWPLEVEDHNWFACRTQTVESLDLFFFAVVVVFSMYRLSWFIGAFHCSMMLVKLFLNHHVPSLRMFRSRMDDIQMQMNFTIHQCFCW